MCVCVCVLKHIHTHPCVCGGGGGSPSWSACIEHRLSIKAEKVSSVSMSLIYVRFLTSAPDTLLPLSQWALIQLNYLSLSLSLSLLILPLSLPQRSEQGCILSGLRGFVLSDWGGTMQHPGGTCVALPNVDACPQLSCAALTFMYLQQVSVCLCMCVWFCKHEFTSCVHASDCWCWTWEVEWNRATACSHLQGRIRETVCGHLATVNA